jgi:DNA polymerase phi
MSKKRPRAQTSVDVEVVAIFEDLANDDEEIRLKAAMALLSKVSVQNDPGVEQLNKILKRLIRGLCSGRKSARLGFSVALTEFVAQHASTTSGSPAKLSVSKVMDVLEEQTRFQGSVSGQVI